MKSFKRILSLAGFMLIIAEKKYAAETIGGIEFTDTTKYIGICVAIAVIAFIMFIAYELDKKSEEKINSYNNVSYDDLPYQDETNDVKMSSVDLETNSEEYDEESLFDSVDEYIENEIENDEIDDIEEDVNAIAKLEEKVDSIEEEQLTQTEEIVEKEEEKSVPKEVFTFDTVHNQSKKKKNTKKKVEIEEDDEEDDDTGVPTFDELLKKSEEEEKSQAGMFDFMAEMEKNLKKDQEKRLERKTAKKTSKKQESVEEE